jgi:superkiller protein 3
LALGAILIAFCSYHSLHKAEALTYYNSGRTYLAAEDDRTGAAQLRQAIDLGADIINLEDAYVRLSMALMRHPYQMATTLKEALALFPENSYLQIYSLAYHSLLPGFPARDQARLESLKTHAKASKAIAQVYTNLGLGYEGVDDLQRAIAAYQRALAFAPDQVKALKRLSAVHYKQGKTGEAISLLRQAQDADANDRSIAYAAILALQLDGQFAEAIAICRKALAASPSADLYNLLGECYEESGQAPPALEAYRQSLALDPDHTSAHRGRARLSSQAGHYQTAFASLEKIIALGQANARDYSNLGNLYFRTGSRPEAETAYREAIRRDPNDALSHHDLAVVLRAMDRPDEAAQELTRAALLNPDDPENHYKLGSLALERGQLQEARQGLVKAIELGSQNVHAYLFLGSLAQEQGQTAEALRLYQQVLNANFPGTNGRVYAQVGVYLKQMGQVAVAIAAYRRALELELQNPEIRLGLGECLYAQGDLVETVDLFRSALALNPSPRAQFHLGLALLAGGQVAEGRAAYAEGIQRFGVTAGQKTGADADLRDLIQRGVQQAQAQQLLDAYWPQ